MYDPQHEAPAFPKPNQSACVTADSENLVTTRIKTFRKPCHDENVFILVVTRFSESAVSSEWSNPLGAEPQVVDQRS